MSLKDFTVMAHCVHCGEWTKVTRYKGAYWCRWDMDFDKAKAVSKSINDNRIIHDREVRKAIGG